MSKAGVLCPRCAAALNLRSREIVCTSCQSRYPRLGSIPILLGKPETYLASCRQQLALLEQQSARTIQSIEEQFPGRDLLPATRLRCTAMLDAVRKQSGNVRAVLEPLLGASRNDAPMAPDGVPAPLQYIHYLYRDWGWPADPEGENERALAALEHVAGEQALGKMLVIGAGACRLAYDLQRRNPRGDTTVLDIDPFLFATAYKVTHGDPVTMCEANAEIDELGSVAKEWTLKAAHGPVDDARFQFLIANGLKPPFAVATFDTVVTPWFIDLVPPDLRNFIAEVRRLLKPGGRWLNFGPLRYRPEISVTRRFSREEVFELARRAGFHMERWTTQSMPYLVSKLNGRGKVEWVLAFAATRLERLPEAAGNEPPAWMLFPDIAIPAFPELSTFRTEDPAEQFVAGAIDGTNSIQDIAAILALQAEETGLSMDQFREIVRRCLSEILSASN